MYSESNQPLWFLRTLIFFTIFSPIIYMILKLSKYTFSIIPLIAVVVFFVEPGYATGLFWMPVYLIGAYLAIYKKEFIEEKGLVLPYGKTRLIFLILNIALMVIIYFFGVVFQTEWYLYYLYRILSGLCIVILFFQIKWKAAPPKYLQNSFFTYCSHACIVGVSTKICSLIFSNNAISMIIGYFVSVVITVGISIVAAEIMKKCCPKFFAILTGNRKERN